MGAVRLTIDTDKCIGSGMCEMLEADVFLIDEDTNIAGVVGSGELSSERALIVIDRCPSGAIVEAPVPGDRTSEHHGDG